jgi:hypothetical protein
MKQPSSESAAQIWHAHAEPEVEFDVEVSAALEWGTEKPCQIGRLEYKLGAHTYVVLTFRYLTEKLPDPWFLTWVGVKDSRDTARLPEGVRPSDAMLAALAEVTE